MSPTNLKTPPIKQIYTPHPNPQEPPSINTLINSLNLIPHIEGGYYAETDRSPTQVPSPFPITQSNTSNLTPHRPGFHPTLRNTSTTIFYLLTPSSPQGSFHRNLGRTIHTLHKGRGQYVIIHPDEEGEKRIETFVVGHDVAAGERLQWIVEGGRYKASFLLPDGGGERGDSREELLISEVVVPGFEFCDHDFLGREGLRELVGERSGDVEWLVRKE